MARRPIRRRGPIDRARRRQAAQRRVGLGAQCVCGEWRAAALVADRTPIVCHACLRAAHGKVDIDAHHVAGRANDPTTIPIPTNDHVAILTERQRDWPEETARNPDGDPLLRAAACVRGFFDSLLYLAERLLLTTAMALESASAFLTENVGRFWWRGTPLEPFSPTR